MPTSSKAGQGHTLTLDFTDAKIRKILENTSFFVVCGKAGRKKDRFLSFADAKGKEETDMYDWLEKGAWQQTEKKTEAVGIGLFSYEEMETAAKKHQISMSELEEARRFSYGRYDSYETFDCVSLEMLDFEDILLSKGSVVVYLEKEKAVFFTSRKAAVAKRLEEIFALLGEKATRERVLFCFFEGLTKEDDIAFDGIEKEIMELEQALIVSGKRDCVSEIISLRKRLMVLKKYYEQLLNVLDILIENENGIFDGKTLRSFKMLSRRTERRFQNVLNLRESVTQVRESYEAEVDISLNQTMKIFTVVTTIFFPLTLIAGWYGMNFEMPEYAWKYGYLFVTFLSLFCILAVIAVFKWKKWF